MTTTEAHSVWTQPKPNRDFYRATERLNGMTSRLSKRVMRGSRRLARRALLSGLLFLVRAALGQAPDPAVQSQSGGDNQSAAEVSKQAANPLANVWLMQFQQNNNWIGMPPTVGSSRIQSDLQFQPLISLKFTENWNLIARPVLQLYDTAPYQAQSGQVSRMTGYGDTILAFAVSPGHKLVGNWLLAAGPTFILPTATESILGQNKWQFGPDAAVGYLGGHFITYAFPQQWFSIGGDGPRASQMSLQYAFVYFLSHGWSVGTNPNMLVNWAAPSGNQVVFPIGPQVGKLVKIGPVPVKFDVQVQYYAIHPDAYGPKWDVQLQVTPVLRSLVKGKLF